MIKEFVKSRLLPRTASALPVSFWHSVSGRPLVIPYYHMVTDGLAPHVRHLYRFRATAEFARDLDFFLRHFQPIGLEDLVRFVREGQRLPDRSLLLTFDDGFREMHDVVMPILLAKGIPAVFFVVSGCVDNPALCHHQKISLILDHWERNQADFPLAKVTQLLDEARIPAGELSLRLLGIRYGDRSILDDVASVCGCDFKAFLAAAQPYLTSDQIRALIKNGFAVGGHSHDHPFYRDLSLEEQLRQTRDSVEFVRKRFGVSYRAFAFPHSDEGVSRAFFERAFGDGVLEVSFGSGGLLRDTWLGHFQRLSMEKTSLPPRSIVAKQFARKVFKTLAGTDVVPRA